MSATYLKLSEAPVLVVRYPECGTCLVETEYDGDDFVCPSCGTCWSTGAADGDTGELYESWSGEKLDGPELDEDEALAASSAVQREKRDAWLRELGVGA